MDSLATVRVPSIKCILTSGRPNRWGTPVLNTDRGAVNAHNALSMNTLSVTRNAMPDRQSSPRRMLPCRLIGRTLAALLMVATLMLLPPPVAGLDRVHFLIGTNPGGGYDQTARSLAQAMIDAGAARSASFDYKGGAGGTIALAHFVSTHRSESNAMLVTGAVMVGAIVQNRPPATLAQATPIARLFYEYNVFAVPPSSPIRTMKDVIDLLKRDPAAVKWGGGSRGSVDQISIARIARIAGINPARINYLPFQGGGEVSAAIAGGHVTIGTSGWNELAPLIRAGKLRAIAITAPERVAGNPTPTLKEQGVDVEISNWRGVYGAPGLSAEQRRSLTRAVTLAVRQKSWIEALVTNGWTPALLTGADFDQFVDSEHVRIESAMRDVGLIK